MYVYIIQAVYDAILYRIDLLGYNVDVVLYTHTHIYI